MKYSAQQYAAALYQALQEAAPKDQNQVIDNFIVVLKNNNDLAHYEKVIEAYEALDRQERGVARANVAFARETEVSDEFIRQLNEFAKTKLEIETKVDESLIGGVVVRIDDLLLDASVKGQLNRLKKFLNT